MSSIAHLLFSNALVERIGWTLLHFLWQGTFIALLLAVLLILMRSTTAAARHLAACAALALSVASVAVTFVHLAPPEPVKVVLGPRSSPSNEVVAPSATPKSGALPKKDHIAASQSVIPEKASSSFAALEAPSAVPAWRASLERAMPWIVFVWLCGVLFVSLRLGVGWLGMRSLAQHARPVLAGEWETRLRELCLRLGIRRMVKLLESHALDGPVTMGWLRPLVLFPAVLITRLPVEQMEMILAHELAHIRRHDFLINWLQCLVETVLFYHPAVWWISRRIRIERENCCDDLAASVTGDPVLYAHALVTLAEERQMTSRRLTIAARGGSLLKRVRRLVTPTPAGSRNFTRVGAGFALLLLVTGLGALAVSKIVGHAAESSASSAPPRGIVVDKDGKPQADAEVMLYWRKRSSVHRVVLESNSPDEIMERVHTDAEGHFHFTKPLRFLPWGEVGAGLDDFLIIATPRDRAPGWVALSRRSIGQSQDLRIITRPTIARTWIITDHAGKPIPGVEAQLMSAMVSNPEGLRQTFTCMKDAGLMRTVSDSEGRITITQMPRNDCYLKLRKGDEVQARYVPEEPESGGGRPEKLKFEPGVTLVGRVADEFGRPVIGARVWAQILWQFDHYDFMFTAITDDEGRYRMEGVMKPGHPQDEAHGDYRVWIEHPKFATAPQVVHVNVEPAVQTLNLQAHTAAQITGRFLGVSEKQPLGGTRLRFENAGARYTPVTDAEGRFHCALPAGRFSITIEAPPEGWWFEQDTMFRDLVVQQAPLDVDLSPYDYAKRVAHVRGKVLQPNGRPAADVEVSATCHQSFVSAAGDGPTSYHSTVRTKADGTFTLPQAPSKGTLSLQAKTAKSALVGFAQMELREGELGLPQPVQLRGTQTGEFLVTDLEGKPRPKLNFSLSLPDFDRKSLSGTTDDRGIAKVTGILPGLEYTIQERRGMVPHFMTFSPEDKERHALILGDQYVIRAVDAQGKTIPIQAISSIHLFSPEEPQGSYWSSLGQEQRQPDGTLRITRNVYPFQCTRIELQLIPAAPGEPFTAEGAWPHNGTNTLILHAKTGLLPPEWKDQPDLHAAPDEVALAVVDDHGQPMPGVAVRLMPFDKDVVQPAQTDAHGIIRMKRPENKNDFIALVLQLDAPGYATRWLANVPAGSHWEVFMDRSTRLKGQLRASDGKSNPGRVGITLLRGKEARVGEGIQRHSPVKMHFETDDEGRYDFLIEPGTYSVRLESEGAGLAFTPKVDIPAGRASELPVKLTTGVAFRLRVVELGTGKPLPGMEVSLLDEFPKVSGEWSREWTNPRVSDAEGWVRWAALPAGKVNVRFKTSQDALEPFTFGRVVSTAAVEKYQRPTGRPLTGNSGGFGLAFNVGPQENSVTAELERGAHLQGQVKREDGTPVKAELLLTGYFGNYPQQIGGGRVTTDDHGHFQGWFPAGSGMSYHWLAVAPAGAPPFACAVSETFDSKPGDDLTVNVIIKPGGRVKGRYVDDKGRPIAGMGVRMESKDRAETSEFNPVTHTDANGNFEFPTVRATRYGVWPFRENGKRGYTTLNSNVEAFVTDGQTADLGQLEAHW